MAAQHLGAASAFISPDADLSSSLPLRTLEAIF
jgi:hypothetical protein